MARFVATRLALSIPSVLAVLTLVFVLVRIVPGDPAIVILGDQVSPAAIARFHAATGLDRPLAEQYLAFLWQVLHGDLGRSLVTNRPVLGSMLDALPYTVELSFAGVAVGLALGIPLGVVAARHRDGVLDWAVRILSLANLSVPAFVSAILMLLLFAIEIPLFPVIAGYRPWSDPVGRLQSLALPALNLGLVMMAYVARVVRAGMMNTLSADFMRTARAKGVPPGRLLWKHALRNVLLSVVTFAGLYFGVLIGNSVLTEVVFSRPGLGKLLVSALERRDYTLLQGLAVGYAVLVVAVNLLTDLAYGLADPRVRGA